jgi:hypothetical protein
MSVAATEIRADPATPAPVRGSRTSAMVLLTAGFPLAALCFTEAYRAAAHNASVRGPSAAAHALFWLAVAVALGTAGGVWWLSSRGRGTAAALGAVLGALLSLPKVLRSPQYLSFYDEQAHLRATESLLHGGSPSGALWAANPLNAVVTDYPGLHLVTGIVAGVTGGSVLVTGTVVIVLARIAGCLAVYLIAERLVRSPGAALLAVVVFVANPAYVFFDAQYSYESLAAPLVAVALVAATRAASVPAAILIALVTVTHHGSSYLLAAVLVTIVLVDLVRRRRPPLGLALLAGLAVALPVVWLLGPAHSTLAYVSPYVRSNLASIPDFLSGKGGPRRLFGGYLTVPVYEKVAGFAAVLILVALFCWGSARQFVRGPEQNERRPRLRRREAPAWTLLLLGAAYFGSLPLVALRDDQVVKRLWEFAFIGVGALCAAPLATLLKRRFHRPVALVAILVVFVGSGVARSGEHIRFPGPYVPSADPRSMTPDVIGAARWMADRQGPDNRIVGDRTLAAAFGSYGEQTPVTYQEDGVPVWIIYTPDEVTPAALQEIQRHQIGWIAVDLRSAGQFPLTGFYFDESEPGAYVDTHLTVRGLTKFTGPGFHRAYDNGNVVLYQVTS